MNVLGMLSSHRAAGPSPEEPSIGISSRWVAVAGVVILGAIGFIGWRSHQARVAEREAAAELAAQPPEITTVSALGEKDAPSCS